MYFQIWGLHLSTHNTESGVHRAELYGFRDTPLVIMWDLLFPHISLKVFVKSL